ncbi:MAG: HSP20 family molecular chaperone IbpA [Bacteroidia bacterium]|jgi:HSP20 family molecular chaperone IbpA
MPKKGTSKSRPFWRELTKRGGCRLNLRLNVGVKKANIRAHVEGGILDLTLPKADACKARKIKEN